MDTSTKKISGVSKKGQEASKYPMSKSNETEETDQNQNFELSAETKALRNHLVLIEILKNLSTKDLLNYRLLNSEWSKLSTEVLLKRDALHVCLINWGSSLEFVLEKSKNLALQELTSVLTTSKGFPTSSFAFHGDLNVPDAKLFLKLHGQQIKEMKLQHHFDYNAILKLLSDEALNLETLILSNPGNFEYESSNLPVQFDKHLPFSSLKSIVISGCTYNKAMLREIIKTAPKLSTCTGYWDFDLTRILFNKMNLLKEFKLIPNRHVMSDLKEVAEKVSNLDKLDIDFHGVLSLTDENLRQLESPTSRILKSSQSTLKEIKFVMDNRLPFVIQWPRLENLRKLQIHGCTQLPRGRYIQLSENSFPNLYTLLLYSEPYDEEPYQIPFQGSAPSVKSLAVRGPFEIRVDILEMFPQLEHLKITEVPNFPATGKIIWQMSSLRKLELGLLAEGVNKVLEVEKTFSGFSEDTIRFFHKLDPKTRIDQLVLERRRIYPSILDLKNLRELRIRNGFFYYSKKLDNKYLDKYPISKGISYLTKKWTFDKMPNLRIVEDRFKLNQYAVYEGTHVQVFNY